MRREISQPKIIEEPFIFYLTISLVIFSVIMVYSATGVMAHEKFGDSYYYVKRQITAAVIGILAMVGASLIHTKNIKKFSPYLFIIAFVLMGSLFIPGLGKSAGGAQRWLSLAGIRFQPGEIVKLMFIVFIAGFLNRHEMSMKKFTDGIIKPALLIILIGGLYLAQPDFGSFVVISSVTVLMIAVSGARISHIFLCIFAGLILMAMLIITSPYRMARVISFLDPFQDPAGKGYQLIQSLIAVGSGKFSGLGIGASQQKLFFLPAAHTDFIFAVIAEELGFTGCVALVALFMMFLFKGLKIARSVSQDTFSFSLSVGLTLLIFLPAMLNMGVVTGLLPTKGMVLPLIGYGGSNLITSLITVGLLIGVSRSAREI